MGQESGVLEGPEVTDAGHDLAAGPREAIDHGLDQRRSEGVGHGAAGDRHRAPDLGQVVVAQVKAQDTASAPGT